MAITVSYQLNNFEIDALQAEGYDRLKLYYSDSPEGPFSDSSVTPSPATLADAETTGEPYVFTFEYANGNHGQWFKVVASDGVGISDLNDSETFHGGGGTTLKRLRQLLGRITHSLIEDSTTSAGAGDGSTAICTSARLLRFRDDYFGGAESGSDGWIFYDTDNDRWTNIDDWTQATGTFSFNPDFSSQVTSGVSFELLSRWTPEEYKQAINWAISACFPKLSKPTIFEGIITEEDVYSYDIPNSIRIINKVEIDDPDSHSDSTDTRTYGRPWQEIPYVPFYDNLQKKIEFKRPLKKGIRIRISGTAMLSRLNSDSDYVEVLEPQSELIVYKAAHRLYSLLANDYATSDVSRYRDQAAYFMALYNEHAQGVSSVRRAKRIWTQQQQWAMPYGRSQPDRWLIH